MTTKLTSSNRTLIGTLHGKLNAALSFVRTHLLVLLVVAYLCSTFFPEPGLRLRATFSTASHVSLIHLLLATLLFTLGLSVSWDRTGEVVRECKWLGAALAVRLAACLTLAFVSRIAFADSPAGLSGLLVGLILVMAMPTAASSSGWSMQLGCNQSVTVALIIGMTVFSVVSAPIMLAASGWLAAEGAARELRLLRTAFDAQSLFALVLMPTLLGISTRSLAPQFAIKLREFGVAISPVLLLLLNYSNGSISLPQLRSSLSFLSATTLLLGCVGLFVTVAVVTKLVTGWLRAERATQLSAILGTGMSNTGLALTLATLAMQEQVELHLAIIVYTFIQHFSVALLAAAIRRKTTKEVRIDMLQYERQGVGRR